MSRPRLIFRSMIFVGLYLGFGFLLTTSENVVVEAIGWWNVILGVVGVFPMVASQAWRGAS